MYVHLYIPYVRNVKFNRYTVAVSGSSRKVTFTSLWAIFSMSDLGWNADGLPSDGCPPDHQVGVGRDPQDASDEGDGEEFPC